jgi:hypothetical protein
MKAAIGTAIGASDRWVKPAMIDCNVELSEELTAGLAETSKGRMLIM